MLRNRGHTLYGSPLLSRLINRALNFCWNRELVLQHNKNGLLNYWAMGLWLSIKKGAENKVVDALSRRDEDHVPLHDNSGCSFLIFFPSLDWIEDLKASYHEDAHLQSLFHDLHHQTCSKPSFSLQNGIIMYKRKVYLSATLSFKARVLNHVHNSPSAGYFGYLKSLDRAKQNWHWQGMKFDLKRHIKECEVSQRVKSETTTLPGLLQPLSIPSKPWEEISMDFVVGLPKSQGYDVIMVVMDRLTKYIHFVPLSHPYTGTSFFSKCIQATWYAYYHCQ